MRIVLLGAPGSGKGTQAKLLRDHYEVPHISTGDILRKAVADEAPLGVKAKEFMDAGELVPDELVIGLMKERLSESDCDNGFLLDGFPRTLAQAESLDGMLGELEKPITDVVDLKVEEAVLLDRIRKRGSEGSGRSDDNVEVAAQRLKVYWSQTAPVSGYYKDKGTFREIDGLGSVEEVTGRVLEALEGN